MIVPLFCRTEWMKFREEKKFTVFQKLIYLFCVRNGRNNYVNNLMVSVDLDKCARNDVVFGNGIMGTAQKRLRFEKDGSEKWTNQDGRFHIELTFFNDGCEFLYF